MMQRYKISKEQAKLYVDSTLSDDTPWLKEILIKDKKNPCLYEKEYENLEDFKKRFIDSRFNNLFKEAFKEWHIEYDNERKKDNKIVDCQLCGQKNIEYLSKITNDKNGKSLIIGSRCISKFPYIVDSYGRTLTQIRKERDSTTNRKLKNEEILEKRIPNILNNIDKFNKLMVNNKYILRSDIERIYRELNSDINSKYNNYLKLKNISENKIEKIVNINNRVLKFFKIYEDYIKFCENDIFGLNIKMCEWISLNGDYNLYYKLASDGKITQNTISQIKEPNFIFKIISKFDELLASNNLLLQKSSIGNKFKISIDNNKILFDVDSFSFIEEYKDYLFNGNINIKINKNELIRNATISDNNSIRKSLDLIANSIYNFGYKYEFSDISLNEVSFYKKKEKEFYVVKLKEFINQFKIYILENNVKNNIEEILKYIQEKSEVYSYIDYKDHLRNYDIKIGNI